MIALSPSDDTAELQRRLLNKELLAFVTFEGGPAAGWWAELEGMHAPPDADGHDGAYAAHVGPLKRKEQAIAWLVQAGIPRADRGPGRGRRRLLVHRQR